MMSKTPRSRRRIELDIEYDTWAWATREGLKNRLGQREFISRFLDLAALALEEQDDAGQQER